jgi:integrase
MAIHWGQAGTNPVKKVKMFREPERRLRFLSLEECIRLLGASSGHIHSIILTEISTGMRRGEILSLTWGQVDFDRKVITVEKSKNDGIRHIPMNYQLTAELQAIKLSTAGQYVFSKKSGGPYREFKTGSHAAMKRAEIKNCRFHDLRHTFASHLVMNGTDIATVKELLGHKTMAMTMRYVHLSQEYKQKAIDSLQFGEKKYCSITAAEANLENRRLAQLIDS